MTDLQELLDRNEITALLARLGRWLDGQGGDPAEIYDAEVVVRSPRGEFRGLAAVVEVAAPRPGEELAQHFHTDVLVALDGGRATVHANQHVRFFHPDQPPHRASGLRLTYQVRRGPEGWRVVEATIELVWLDTRSA
ncbi:nuclear transport factor 2 family protein [Crossiella sp. CA-258035]|uniref:nuclear transport factor 2 family protein n=1 Tax=Crossiella sp. CA-258035 TaxID=2981138 RepID=UPI0024BCD256|nr:nuclear transport factor 2 family protein [Crossiella sp. CA-258035]WHT16736.1 nuclear transport factor 2 family protein [Crossiella sp. CA-258035]